MLTPDADLNVVHIHEEPHGRAYGMSTAHQGMTRRSLLAGTTAVAAAAIPATPALAARRTTAGQVPALWREFVRTPFTHPQIPFIGRAGYRGGEECFPRHRAVVDIRHYGAVPDGTTDCAPAINRAIAHYEKQWSEAVRKGIADPPPKPRSR